MLYRLCSSVICREVTTFLRCRGCTRLSNANSSCGMTRFIGSSQKGGFQKGGFGGCSPGTKTGTRVRSPKPPFWKPPFYLPMTLCGVDKRVVSKRVVSADVPPERKSERGYVRQNHPFAKPPFYLPVKETQFSNLGFGNVEMGSIGGRERGGCLRSNCNESSRASSRACFSNKLLEARGHTLVDQRSAPVKILLDLFLFLQCIDQGMIIHVSEPLACFTFAPRPMQNGPSSCQLKHDVDSYTAAKLRDGPNHDHGQFRVHLAAPDFSILGYLWMMHHMPLLHSGAQRKRK